MALRCRQLHIFRFLRPIKKLLHIGIEQVVHLARRKRKAVADMKVMLAMPNGLLAKLNDAVETKGHTSLPCFYPNVRKSERG